MKKVFTAGIFFCIFLLSGCGLKNKAEAATEQEVQQTDVPAGGQRGREFVILNAEVKKIEDHIIQISSDEDQLSGVFSVEVSQDVYDVNNLSGGSMVRVQMECLNSKTPEGLEEYRANSLDEVEEAQGAREDILLRKPPAITLSDVLSSTASEFKVYSGNYEWSVPSDPEMQSVTACGPSPLDQGNSDAMGTLEIPEDNNLGRAAYSVSCSILPDKMIIKEWDIKDAGTQDSIPYSTTTIYGMPYMPELQRGRIYSIHAAWPEEKLDTNGFFGTAEYVFKTE